MRFERSIWIPLAVPTLIGGLAAALGAVLLLGSPAAAAFAVAGSLAGMLGSGLTILRNARRAGALLRRPELRAAGAGETGVYRGLIDETLGLVEQFERESRESTRTRTQLEARSQVRRRQVRQLESMLDCLDQPLLITDVRDRVQFLNGAARRLLERLGASDGGLENGRPPDLSRGMPSLVRHLEETRTRSAATDRRTVELDVESGGLAMAYRALATTIYDDDGTLLGVATILSDIRDERKEKTRHAEFVSSVCHELKTPMAGIKAFIEMLMDGDVTEPEERQELYGFIDVQVDRLTRLVNNMLNLARIESGVIKVQREDCELNDLLGRALDVVQPTADDKQIRLVSELSDLYIGVHVDSDLFGQAVINLLSNAVKYTPEGGEVRLRSRMDEGRATIEVRDSGMGIPAESLPHIFERFYRVPENNKAAAGTGLGLSLVSYIVKELHSGEIAVESEVGRGTCFSVTIPLGHRRQMRRRPEPTLCAT